MNTERLLERISQAMIEEKIALFIHTDGSVTFLDEPNEDELFQAIFYLVEQAEAEEPIHIYQIGAA